MTDNSLMKAAFKDALKRKENDLNSFVWKGEKRKVDSKYVQDEEKMMDMTPERLRECWNRCKLMLYNDDYKNLGRFKVLQGVYDEINKCNVELLLRYYENTYLKEEGRKPILRTPTLMTSLRKFMANNAEIEDWSEVPVSKITDGLPVEFQNISVSDLFDGCTDYLGVFNKQHLTLTFITKMGLWFTKAEESELKGKNNLEKIDYVRTILHFPDKLKLRFNETGLSFHEMRAILVLPKKQKYSDMTTEQLVTLRNKILPRFQREVDKHISSWKLLQKQLEAVAQKKGIVLSDDSN